MHRYKTTLEPLLSPMSSPDKPLPTQVQPPEPGYVAQQVIQVIAQDGKGGIVPFVWVLWVKYDDSPPKPLRPPNTGY